MRLKSDYDVIIIGAGAAGLMAAATASEKGKSVCVIDHAKRAGEKIRISGGGRCNFTNLYCSHENFLSQNPHFCKSALSQYTQYDFIHWVEKSNITYHEKTLGQLFCDVSAKQIIAMLVDKCTDNDVDIAMETSIQLVNKNDNSYDLKTSKGTLYAKSLIVACGGLSIPKIGATGFGYDLARQFGHDIVETRAGLVPLTFEDDLLIFCKSMAGVSVDAIVQADTTQFREGLLFTHRGLSGPSILQISSYWHNQNNIKVNLKPETDVYSFLVQKRDTSPKQDIQSAISELIPKRLMAQMCELLVISGNLADQSNDKFRKIADMINTWTIKPNGTEGYRTAEVTLGGVNTDGLSSKTMESKNHKGLFFIGEVVDVTGHLGGHNFQWAWSSGYVAGINV
jgi:predicted Rossmann fold flavoprotein